MVATTAQLEVARTVTTLSPPAEANHLPSGEKAQVRCRSAVPRPLVGKVLRVAGLLARSQTRICALKLAVARREPSGEKAHQTFQFWEEGLRIVSVPAEMFQTRSRLELTVEI